MANGVASLLSQQPGSQAPPEAGGAGQDGRDAAGGGSVQSLLQQPGGAPGGAPGAGPPAPSHEQTAAALYHLNEFQRQWKKLLDIPDIGKKDIKGDVLEMMADVMGEGLVTLPQVMNELKQLPTDALGQRQWVEEHFKKAQQAAVAILTHHAQAFPRTGLEPIPEPAKGAGTMLR